MQQKSFLLLPLIALTLTLVGCGPTTISLHSSDGAEKVIVKVEVADNPKEHEQGLTGRTTMAPDEGMLFAFKTPSILQFWMKDTKIPLDILFFDEAGDFVNYTTMQPCIADPCPVYKSAALSRYALEVVKGYRDEHKIGVGWKLDLDQLQKISNPT